MLTRDLVSHSIPSLQPKDTVFHAMQLMGDFHVTHLPVVNEDAYIGLVNEEQLLHYDEETLIENVEVAENNSSVLAEEHFLKALSVAVTNKQTVVPVLEGTHMQGVITSDYLLKQLFSFLSLSQPGAMIVLEIESTSYSFAEISRIVETNDAQITQLNTAVDAETGIMQLTIRVNKTEVSDIVATFQRYEYDVKYYFGEELYENELRNNYNNLMNYLQV